MFSLLANPTLPTIFSAVFAVLAVLARLTRISPRAGRGPYIGCHWSQRQEECNQKHSGDGRVKSWLQHV